ncbi:MAG TPA: serine/threonine-protein kinase, partial [Gemmataceae bacterium]|nr:serine/threonine-protein kinase [Gemmataceae bacterium]
CHREAESMSHPLSFVAFDVVGCGALLVVFLLVGLLITLRVARLRDARIRAPHDEPRRVRMRRDASPPLMRQCPECGKDLPADAPGGLCPQCLLKGVISSAHDAVKAAPVQGTVPYAGPGAPAVEELAPLFPQLEVIELIGQGGMGAVYKARQPALDRLVALKVLPREAGRAPAFAERFGREARALARLSHPNIVAVHDVGKAGDLYYFVMEYIDGVNLRQLLRDGHLTPEQALRIVPQICDALQFAHEEGVVHRDIKPENILLDRKGRVKIADFGLAKLLGRDTGDFTLTGSRQVMGTLYYMAPEQVERPLEVDHRADIYSLGVVFYELLTGQLPVGRFPAPSEKAGTDAFLDGVVLRALEREPARRYQHASDVKSDVESHGRTSPLQARGTGAAERAEADVRTAGLIGLIVPIVVVCLVIAGTIAVVLQHQPGEGIVAALIVAWSVAGVVMLAVVLRSLSVLRRLCLTAESAAARDRAAGAAGLIGLVIPILVVSLTVLATAVALVDRRPNEDPVPPLIVSWSIAAAVVLVVIMASLNVVGQARQSPAERDKHALPAARVRGPAVALLVVGILNTALPPVAGLVGLAIIGPPPLLTWLTSLPGFLLIVAVGVPIIIGAIDMLRLGSHRWATAAAGMALLPFGLAWPIGLPVGIWALVVLTDPEVKAAFGRQGPPRAL